MQNPQQIHETLRLKFDKAIVHFEGDAFQPWIEVDPGHVGEVAVFLRNDPDLAFDRLLCLSGVDNDGYDEKGKGKHREINQYEEDGTVKPVTEPATADLCVVYHLESSRHGHRVTLKARVPRDAPEVATVGHVWTTAQWGERETFDFFGIEFLGHPDLRRIFLPEDWEGWPLRKDYQMPSRYHDVPLEGLGLAERDRP